jgi:hypothetical protein
MLTIDENFIKSISKKIFNSSNIPLIAHIYTFIGRSYYQRNFEPHSIKMVEIAKEMLI